MKWRSKVTGNVFNVFDSWSTYKTEPEYRVTIRPIDSDNTNGASLAYAEFIEAFEKVEE